MNTSKFLKSVLATAVLFVAAQVSFAQSEGRQAAPNSDRGAVKAMPVEQVKVRQAQSTDKPAQTQTPAATGTRTAAPVQQTQPASGTTVRPATDGKNAATVSPKPATTGRPAVKPATDDRK